MKSNDNNKKVLAIVLSVLVVIAICVAIGFQHNENLDFQKLSMIKQKKAGKKSKYVKCQLFSNIGSQNYLMMEMAIPYEDKTQYSELNRKLDRIKSDMLTDIDQKSMTEWVKERDYDAIKGELLKVINKHTEKPVEHIYFDSFLYQ